jgi:hypothetical protein
MPPGPVAVTSRCSASAAAQRGALGARPTNGVTGIGSTCRPDRTCRTGTVSACLARLRRSGRLSLRSIADTWVSTVRCEMNSSSAICALVRCRAIRARTSVSRGVSSVPAAGPALVTPISLAGPRQFR